MTAFWLFCHFLHILYLCTTIKYGKTKYFDNFKERGGNMTNNNITLIKYRKKKNDEFFTRLEDIEKIAISLSEIL